MSNGGLLAGIMNPAQVDVLGSMDAGRERQATRKAGDLLAESIGGKVGELARLSPDKAMAYAKATNTPIDDMGRVKNLMGWNIMGAKLFQAGQGDEAANVLERAAAQIQEQTGQVPEALLKVVSDWRTNGAGGEIVKNFTNAGLSLDPSSQGESFSLGEGQVRYDSKGNPIARNIGAGGGKSGLPAEAVSFNDLIKDFTPEQQKTAKLVKAGLKGRAMSNAVLSAIESGDIANLAEAKAEIRQAEKFGELTGSSRAKAIDKGFDSIIKIDRGIKNIDDAISSLDRGAGVGAVEKIWPSIKAASVELDNVRGRMALDVVGATTFGALSKGELDLAKDVALPTGLDTPQLIDYLTRKKAAQTKLRAYYNEQIQFLDQGGTIAGFLRKKEGTASTNQEEARPSESGGEQAVAEGATATNAQGQKIVYSNGQWSPM